MAGGPVPQKSADLKKQPCYNCPDPLVFESANQIANCSKMEHRKPKLKPLKTAIVRCNKFRCQATLWDDGKWRDLRGKVLDVLEVVTQLGPFVRKQDDPD